VSEELENRLRANKQRRRAEQGGLLRQNFIARFERATGVLISSTDFLPLEESDPLMHLVGQRVQTTTVDATWHDLSPLVYAGLAALADRLGEASLYLDAAYSDLMGMAKVPVAPLLNHLDVFWMPEDEDLRLVSDDAEHGLLLEWNDHWVELRTWGWVHEALYAEE
jgi:hypothetical protein